MRVLCWNCATDQCGSDLPPGAPRHHRQAGAVERVRTRRAPLVGLAELGPGVGEGALDTGAGGRRVVADRGSGVPAGHVDVAAGRSRPACGPSWPAAAFRLASARRLRQGRGLGRLARPGRSGRLLPGDLLEGGLALAGQLDRDVLGLGQRLDQLLPLDRDLAGRDGRVVRGGTGLVAELARLPRPGSPGASWPSAPWRWRPWREPRPSGTRRSGPPSSRPHSAPPRSGSSAPRGLRRSSSRWRC